jgi:hypothetical protein
MKSVLNTQGPNSIDTIVLVENNNINQETRDTLESLFKAVINYYKMKNLISQVRYGVRDEVALSRIAELNDEMNKIHQVINESHESIGNLTINSELKISFPD